MSTRPKTTQTDLSTRIADANLQAARAAAAAGFPVFPCSGDNKIPLMARGGELTDKVALSDQGEQRTWEQVIPDWLHANIRRDDGGMKGGYYKCSLLREYVDGVWLDPDSIINPPCVGIVVPPKVVCVDVDAPDEFPAALLAQLREAAGFITETPSGGLHLWFKAPPGMAKMKPLYGADWGKPDKADRKQHAHLGDWKPAKKGYAFAPGSLRFVPAADGRGARAVEYRLVKGEMSLDLPPIPESARRELWVMYDRRVRDGKKPNRSTRKTTPAGFIRPAAGGTADTEEEASRLVADAVERLKALEHGAGLRHNELLETAARVASAGAFAFPDCKTRFVREMRQAWSDRDGVGEEINEAINSARGKFETRRDDGEAPDGGGPDPRPLPVMEAILERAHDRLLLVGQPSWTKMECDPMVIDDRNGCWRTGGRQDTVFRLLLADVSSDLEAACPQPKTKAEGILLDQCRAVQKMPPLKAIPYATAAWERMKGPKPMRVSEADLDADGRFLGVANGAIDLLTGTFLPPEEAKSKMLTAASPHAYKPFAEHDADAREDVLRLFAHMSDELGGYWRQALAFALRGEPERVIYAAVGPPASGKSTLFAALRNALGNSLAQTAQPDALQEISGSTRGGATPEMFSFVNPARLALVDEAEPGAKKRLSGTRIKQLTASGVVSVRSLYRETEMRRATASIVMAANPASLPRFGLHDSAMRDRYREIPYPPVPDEAREAADGSGESYRARMERCPKRGAAMLAWLIEGSVELGAAARPPEPPAEVMAAVEARAEEEGGTLTEFATLLQRKPGARLTLVAAWDAYRLFCDENAPEQIGAPDRSDEVDGTPFRLFARRLAERVDGLGVPTSFRVDGRKVKGWMGWAIVEISPDSPNPFNDNELPPPDGSGGTEWNRRNRDSAKHPAHAHARDHGRAHTNAHARDHGRAHTHAHARDHGHARGDAVSPKSVPSVPPPCDGGPWTCSCSTVNPSTRAVCVCGLPWTSRQPDDWNRVPAPDSPDPCDNEPPEDNSAFADWDKDLDPDYTPDDSKEPDWNRRNRVPPPDGPKVKS